MIFVLLQGTYWVACAAEMMAENSFTASRIPSTWIGNLIARAIFIVNNCPIHSRYKRRGLGIHTVLDLEDYIITPDQVGLISFLLKFGKWLMIYGWHLL